MERNSTTSKEANCCFFSTPQLDHVMVPVLVVEFMLGLMSNLIALWMFASQKIWKSHSVYLAHLTTADAVLMLCLPFRADYYIKSRNWIYGSVFCQIDLFMLSTCRAAGIFFLTTVAIDRYFKILHPQHRINRMGLRCINGICCGLWLLIFTMNIYLFTGNHLINLQCETFTICMDFSLLHEWSDIFFILQFAIPAGIVSFCTYSITAHLRNNTVNSMGRISRAVYFVMAVALVFIFCYLPSTVSCLAVLILKALYDDCSHFHGASVVFYYLICLTYFNSALNPVLYYFSSPAFNRTVRNFFCKLFGKETQDAQSNNGNDSVAPNGNAK
ncbi:hydroxycarboxylic acid receptor 2-like [Alosa alosa]|uniref:hydroxycarboxylic acid receptor 2-like n=1 Tax=Alosa alosa TaxID=278164 RepID=UPI0020152174|nr:hydroxycarboxylic acid receptor 2-like [Alosa alosa]